MKRVFRSAICLVVAFAPLALSAQAPQQLPLDPNVRSGQLENGLTYYIRHNNEPADRAEFYIVQKVGSILEEESQRGLAHFLEHMAFNGTKNFPGKSMLHYLEQNGVKFGTNVNAYTSIDETVYNLSRVPTTNANLVDSCLLVLHDWSGFISLEDEEIDSERGVIHEEWRTRQNPFLRMYESTILPALYPNNRYGHRMPIGLMEVVDNFPYEVLRDYYHTWYRPDLQAIVVVGDIDVDKIEARVKDMWKDIPAPVDAKERVYFPIENNVEPIVAVDSDKEMQQNILSIMYKHDPLPAELNNSPVGLIMNYANNMITMMLNTRYQELTQKADAPFLQAGADFGDFMISQTKDALGLTIVFKDNAWKEGLDQLLAVANSAKEFGFTPSEYERSKAELRSQIEKLYNDREKQSNGALVQEYVNHFLHSTPAVGIEMEYTFFNQAIEMITLEQINEIMNQYITDENVAIMMMATAKEGVAIPTDAELLSAYNEAKAIEPIAYVEEFANVPLMSEMPQKGSIVKEGKGPFGSTEWVLSNGAKVVFKKTDFKKDEIDIYAMSPGGKSHFDDADLLQAKVMDDVITLGGVSQFKATDLSKLLSGKQVSIAPFVGVLTEGIQGSTTPKDLETAMQLVYLNFTSPRADQEAFDAWKTRTSAMLANLEKNPQVIFSDSLTGTMYNHNIEKKRINVTDVNNIDYPRLIEMVQERFANAADFTFVFVGNVDAAELRPLVEQYIATLPAGGKNETLIFDEPRIAAGAIENRFDIPMTTPKTTVYNIFSGKIKDTLKNNVAMDMLSQVMDIVYVETVREKEGGTYGVSSRGMIKKTPEDEFVFLYAFDTGAEKRERLEDVAYNELARVAENGPTKEAFDKVKEYMLKRQAEQVKTNAFWQNALVNNLVFGDDTVTDYIKTVEKMTPKDIQKLAKKIISSGNHMEVVSTGVEI